MGKRDRAGREARKPKKKDVREAKPLSSVAPLQPMSAPEVIRRKRRVEEDVEDEDED